MRYRRSWLCQLFDFVALHCAMKSRRKFQFLILTPRWRYLNLTRLPIPPYPHIKFSSSKFYTVRTFRGGAFRLIRKYKNAFLRFYRIYTEMALPESSASAYSAISANIKFIGQPRPRNSCGWRNFLRLGAPKKFRPLRLCPARCICRRQRSRANCLFRHIRKY